MFGSVCLCSKPFTLKHSMPNTKLLPHTSLHTHLLAQGTSPESMCLPDSVVSPQPLLTSQILSLPLQPLWHDYPSFAPSAQTTLSSWWSPGCMWAVLTVELSPQTSTGPTASPLPVSGQCHFINETFTAQLQGHSTTPFPSYPSSLLSLLCSTGLFSSLPALDYKFHEGRDLCLLVPAKSPGKRLLINCWWFVGICWMNE